MFWVGAVLVRQASSAVSGVGNLADPLVWSNENGECGQSTATLTVGTTSHHAAHNMRLTKSLSVARKQRKVFSYRHLFLVPYFVHC